MWQWILFDCSSDDDLASVLRGLSSVATLKEGTGFFFFSQLPGEPEFKLDCEVIEGGLITSREGAYCPFFGRFIDALTSKFGTLEIGRDGAIPQSL